MTHPDVAVPTVGPRRRRTAIFLGVWLTTTLGTGWWALIGGRRFDQVATLPGLLALLACTATFLWWLPSPVLPEIADAARTRRGLFALLVVLAVAVLFPLRTLIGPPLLFGLPAVALLALVPLRHHLAWREVRYALGLALIAGVAGLGARWIDFRPPVWAGLQVALVATSCPVGWAILRNTGLLAAGWGRSLALTDGEWAALRGFGSGLVLATPWALVNVALGGARQDSWAHAWWQPLIAIQPAIAEESWGRLLLVPLLFVVLRRVARARAALTAALLIAGYWFAYLHTPGGPGALPGTLLLGTLYSLPISYLWLRGGLESAIGFHFWIDFVRFATAYLGGP